ncbi:MAG: DUF692 domain-containing protein [Alphaproteobacteria bacterium]|nr:DUF692 domain-containing protein [Alphaproteobacteria bacterium]
MTEKILGFGLGLRAPHYELILREKPPIDWFEIISDNYLNAHRGYWDYLANLRTDYPLVMHGVSLSIGSTDPVNVEYVRRLKALATHIDAAWVSDHLCFTGINREYTHDLLPIPYTQEALEHIVPRVQQVQEILGRNFVFENASTYLEFDGATMGEAEFLCALHQRTGAKILLDVNNVYVNSFNHGWSAQEYIDVIPADAIQQYHLSGHTDRGSYLFDTHKGTVDDAVWELYRYTVEKKGFKSTMVEWDDAIPEFAVLQNEIDKARAYVPNASYRFKEVQ